jgi:tetratricopeptide (TPR) repeat protein
MIFFLGCVVATLLGLVQHFFRAGRENFRIQVLPLIILTLAASLAYANAWPDTLIWDDKVFAVDNRLLGVSLSDVQHYFTDDVWATVGASTDLYRPLLLLSVALDIHLFGDWVAGFHLVNIFLHVLVTLAVFGLIRYLLLVFGGESPKSAYAALLAALVFAVHPIHTEVVNSIFNRSEMLVSLGVAGGLWWFLPTVDRHPWKAWGLLCLVYLVIMLCRETGIVLPAITVVFLWLTTTGNWRQRLRKCLPVLWLLLPLAIYLGLRANALDAPMTMEEMTGNTAASETVQTVDDSVPKPITRPGRGQGIPVLGLYFSSTKLLPAITVWFDSINLMFWPNPLLTFHERSSTNQWLALAAQLAVLGFAAVLLVRKKPGLFLGLAFFYLAILPASRIIGEPGTLPHLAERYLYMPSVGITIVLAFGLGWLVQRVEVKTAVVPVLLAITLLTPLTWVRNAQWRSTVRLAEADYRNNRESVMLLEVLVSSLLMKGDLINAEALCDENTQHFPQRWYLAGNCGQVYASLKHWDKAELAFRDASRNADGAATAHYGMAVMYLRLDRRDEATTQFEQAVASEKLPFMQQYLSAEMLMRLYPKDRTRLLEAKTHLEKSIELQPQYYHGRQRLEELNAMIRSAGNSESE